MRYIFERVTSNSSDIVSKYVRTTLYDIVFTATMLTLYIYKNYKEMINLVIVVIMSQN